MADFRKLRVWTAAHDLGLEANRVTLEMETRHNRELCDQLNRSAMSISANIAEGGEHESAKEQARFLQYSIASASETEGHIQMARDINSMSYTDFVDLHNRVVSVRRMLRRLIDRVRARIPPEEPRRAKRRRRSR